jgi:glycyl-tRNA synthetase alpha subunit
MPLYEARFLTHGNAVFSTVRFAASHDVVAVRHTNEVLRTSIGMGHEIWQDGRLVHQETYRHEASFRQAPNCER